MSSSLGLCDWRATQTFKTFRFIFSSSSDDNFFARLTNAEPQKCLLYWETSALMSYKQSPDLLVSNPVRPWAAEAVKRLHRPVTDAKWLFSTSHSLCWNPHVSAALHHCRLTLTSRFREWDITARWSMVLHHLGVLKGMVHPKMINLLTLNNNFCLNCSFKSLRANHELICAARVGPWAPDETQERLCECVRQLQTSASGLGGDGGWVRSSFARVSDPQMDALCLSSSGSIIWCLWVFVWALI